MRKVSGGTGGYGFSGAPAGLPVKLIDFTATAVENSYIRLDWSTALEINNAGFEVERSTNGIEFTKIGWMVGHDNSTTQQVYTFDDKTVLPNTRYYYRLKQVDNGNVAFEYSKVISGMITGKKINENDILVYPNPVDKNLFVVVPEGKVGLISITNILGEVIYTSSDNVQNKTMVPFENLSSGYYFVTVKGDNLLVTKKILKAFDE
jgi:hypothetical protein